MGRASVCCFLDSSAFYFIDPDPHVAPDLAFFKPQGKRPLIAVQIPLWVTRRLFGGPWKASSFGGLADETCDEADIRLLMSVVGGRADVACQGLSGPFIAKSGSSQRVNRNQNFGTSRCRWMRAVHCIKSGHSYLSHHSTGRAAYPLPSPSSKEAARPFAQLAAVSRRRGGPTSSKLRPA